MLPQNTAGLRSAVALVASGYAATFEYETAKLVETFAVSRQSPNSLRQSRCVLITVQLWH